MAVLLKLGLFFAIQTVLYTLFVTRSPYTMVSAPPTTTWADQPVRLITTPQYETKKTDFFTAGATHMALLHNAIIRGYNSIYLQAPHVEDADKADFIEYAKIWYRFVHTHSEDEEKSLFTKIEEILNDDKVWGDAHEEHEALLPGLEQFNSYLTALPSPSAFSGQELIRIMDTFSHVFEHHFHHEVVTIAALSSHPNAPKEGSDELREATFALKKWGKSTVTKAGVGDVTPFFLFNLDGTTEDGLWANWPPMPAPVKWGLVNLAGAWYGRSWKFASCDGKGVPRGLYALEGKQGKSEL